LAEVIGVPGRDAVIRSRQEFSRAADELGRISGGPRLYDEDDLARIGEVIRQPAHWLAGAEGECRTARELERLPDGFVIFHDFHARGRDGAREVWNIDHIVLGPTGVFVIDSKNHHKHEIEPAEVSSDTADLIRRATSQAMQVRDLLGSAQQVGNGQFFVQPVVVFVRAHTLVRKTRDGNTWVLPLRLLLKHLEGGKRRLTATDIAWARKVLLQKRAMTPAS
jgi:hypothetical protein